MSGAAFLEATFHHLTSHHDIRLACDTSELYRVIMPAASTRELTVSICTVAFFSSRSARFPETREHGVQGWYRRCDDLPNHVSIGFLWSERYVESYPYTGLNHSPENQHGRISSLYNFSDLDRAYD